MSLLRSIGGREALVQWLAQELDRQGCAADTLGANSRYVIQLIEDDDDETTTNDGAVSRSHDSIRTNVHAAAKRRARRSRKKKKKAAESMKQFAEVDDVDVDSDRVKLPTDALCQGSEKIKAAKAAQWVQSVSSDPYEVDVLIDEVRYRLQQLRSRAWAVSSYVSAVAVEDDEEADYWHGSWSQSLGGEDSAISSSPEADDYFCEFPALGATTAMIESSGVGAWCAGPPPALCFDEDEEEDEGVVEEEFDEAGSVCSEGSDLLQLVTKILHHFNSEIEAAHEDAEDVCAAGAAEDFSWLWDDCDVHSSELDQELEESVGEPDLDSSDLWELWAQADLTKDAWPQDVSLVGSPVWTGTGTGTGCSDLDSSGRGSQQSPQSDPEDLALEALDPQWLKSLEMTFAELEEVAPAPPHAHVPATPVCVPSAGPPEKSRRACSFFLRGHCKKEDCEFAHDLNLVTCKFWELSECFKGDTCPFLHGYPSLED